MENTEKLNMKEEFLVEFAVERLLKKIQRGFSLKKVWQED